jgi:membrane-associated phospholipid phosphatase
MTRRVEAAIDALSTAVTWPGYAPQNRILPPIVAMVVGLARGPRMAAFQFAAWGVQPVGLLLKRIARRPRPLRAMLPLDGHRASGSSFPSTHVAMYSAYYGFTAWVLARRGGGSRLAATVPLTLIAVIGPSRIREGKHRPSDVVAGYALGATYLALLIALTRRAEAAETRASTAMPERDGRNVEAEPVDGRLTLTGTGRTLPSRVDVSIQPTESPWTSPRHRGAGGASSQSHRSPAPSSS